MNTIKRDIEETVIPSMKEEEVAVWLENSGKQVRCHQGRFWQYLRSGIFGPVHWMSRMSDEEAVRPVPYSLGFRTTLSEENAHLANGALPLHLISDPKGYDLSSVGSRQRNKIRKGLKEAKIVEFSSPDPLLKEGKLVYDSAHARNGYGKPLSTEEYEQQVRHYYSFRGVVLGGLVDGRLGGYLTCFAVNGTAYIRDLFLHSDALPTQISSALVFSLIQVCGRSPEIREVVHSPHMPENEGLSRHKEEMGFSVVPVPSRVWFAPVMKEILIEGYVRRSRPHAYYRLYGSY